MIVVKTKDDKKVKRMIVLKALGHHTLRLSPGLNNVDVENLDAYTKGNPAAKAMVDNLLEIVDRKLSGKELSEANAAKEKNDALNKSATLLKSVTKQLDEQKGTNKDLSAEFEKLQTQLNKIKSDNAEAVDSLKNDNKTLTAQNDEMSKFIKTVMTEKINLAKADVETCKAALKDAKTDADKKTADKALKAANKNLTTLIGG